jgi:hypothetical protein
VRIRCSYPTGYTTRAVGPRLLDQRNLVTHEGWLEHYKALALLPQQFMGVLNDPAVEARRTPTLGGSRV